jgi:hypothetical protein
LAVVRLASSRNALVLGAVGAAILLVVLALTIATGDTVPSEDGVLFVAALAMGGLGTVIAYRQPENPIGWLMVGVMAVSLTQIVAQLYSVLDYRQHGGRLPLGTVAVYWDDAYSLLTLLAGIPIVLLFPDGRLSRGWRSSCGATRPSPWSSSRPSSGARSRCSPPRIRRSTFAATRMRRTPPCSTTAGSRRRSSSAAERRSSLTRSSAGAGREATSGPS